MLQVMAKPPKFHTPLSLGVSEFFLEYLSKLPSRPASSSVPINATWYERKFLKWITPWSLRASLHNSRPVRLSGEASCPSNCFCCPSRCPSPSILCDHLLFDVINHKASRIWIQTSSYSELHGSQQQLRAGYYCRGSHIRG